MQYAQSYIKPLRWQGEPDRNPSGLWSDTVGPSGPKQTQTAAYSSVTDRRLKMGSRRPSKLGDSAPLEEELREQEEV